MVRFFLVSMLLLSATHAFPQIAKDFLVGGGFDIIKTDNDGLARKAQVGFEGNYFITKQFTATGGLELWSDNKASLVMGGRWYPMENFFTRVRGLIGENDISFGAGWNKPIDKNWHFEAIGDFYFEGEFAVRAGLMYVIRTK
jgi:hypothetical protein